MAAEIAESELVCILDAGSQFAKVIDRRVRDLCVHSELTPFDTPASELKHFRAIIISGGPDSVYSESAPNYDPNIFKMGIPILGICYGMQLMNHIYGGSVTKHDTREDGQFPVNICEKSQLFENLPERFSCLLTHGDSVANVAEGFKVSARSDHGVIAGIEDPIRKLYGLQFHPEVDLTEHGSDILRNFLFGVARLRGDYSVQCRRTQAVVEIRRAVGAKKVLVLVSGGVDSSVCAALLKDALPPEQIFAIHIDNGFMRKNESTQVERALADIGLNLRVINAAEQFYCARTSVGGVLTDELRRTVNPEHKRKIIGDTFMVVSQEAVEELGLKFEDVFLAQGTLRPDLIESASKLASKGGTADVIKTHHNDTQLVRDLRDAGRIIEPLKDYHKDEVRQLGRQLGLPAHLVQRQPFPGPGLAVRILCAEAAACSDRDAEMRVQLRAFSEEMAGLKAVLMPVKTVGVQGDGRSYSRLVALTLPTVPTATQWSQLATVAKAIPRRVLGVSRVVLVFGGEIKEEQTTITPTHLTPDVIRTLQEADSIVNRILAEFDLLESLSQVPVILFPADFGVKGSRGICIRTFITNDFMTGVPAIPGKTIPEEAVVKMVDEVLKSCPGVSRVCYDLTPKPPGTTEWE
eukprot:218812_1